MKRVLIFIFTIVFMFLFTACGDIANNSFKNQQFDTIEVKNKQIKNNSKILVAYFSRAGENYDVGYIEKGNTKIVAEIIAETIGANIFEIKPVENYPLNYQECTEIAKKELENNSRPKFEDKIDNIDQYDTIFLGYPIWWSDMPMIIYSFLESYNFNGKTIIPFCTAAGDNLTGKEVNIPKIAKGSIIRDGIGIKGTRCQYNPENVRIEVVNWLKNLSF